MGIKSFFRNLGRSIKRGFNNFVAGAGDVVGKAGTFIQQKAVPAIASGATKAAGLLDKLAPAADAAGVGGEAAEASQVLGKVGDVAGKFGKFIGSDIANKPPVVANAQQILAFGQSPFGMAIRKSQGLTTPITAADAASYAAGVKPTAAPMAAPPKPNMLAALGKPLIGSNPATYTPKPSSGIEAPPPASQPKIAVDSGGVGGVKALIA